MKILVVSGFLGAGKTRFIKTLSERTGRDFCIFENEYAQAGIDRTVLNETGRLNIWELTENCICCSGKQDFASSVLTIANTIDPEYLIVEPTGVAKLSSIMQNLKKIQYERISILPPIVIIDGNSLMRRHHDHRDIFNDQIINAGSVILSKTESADDDELRYAEENIRKLNPYAELMLSHYSKQDDEWWEGLLMKNPDGSSIIEQTGVQESDPVENITLTGVSLDNPVQLISFLEMITIGVFGGICRAKGYLPCGRDWLRFDTADRLYSITGIDVQEESRAVFIGDNIFRSGIREILNPEMKYITKSDIKKKMGLRLPDRYN